MKRMFSFILIMEAVFISGCDDRPELEFDTIGKRDTVRKNGSVREE